MNADSPNEGTHESEENTNSDTRHLPVPGPQIKERQQRIKISNSFAVLTGPGPVLPALQNMRLL